MYLLGDIGNSETKLCFVSEKNKREDGSYEVKFESYGQSQIK